MRSISIATISAALLISAISSGVVAKSCGRLEIAGMPTNSDHLICRDQYLMSYSEATKSPDWIIFNLSPDTSSVVAIPSLSETREDFEVFLANRALPSDYSYTKLVPGPLVPSFLSTGTRNSNRDLSYLSAHVPMDSAVANGLWKEALTMAGKCAQSTRNGVYVTTGPIWSKSGSAKIGVMLPVPVGMYLVMLEKADTYRMQAWVIPNQNMQGRELREFQVSVNAIEKPTGLAFYNRVPRDIQSIQKLSTEGFCAYD